MENYDISQATGMMDQEAISLKKDEGDSVHLPITSDELTIILLVTQLLLDRYISLGTIGPIYPYLYSDGFTVT